VLAALVAGAALAAAPAPPINDDPIPFGAKRIAETRAYAKRHYGFYRARLIDPKVIVIHFTGSDSYESAYSTFASNARDAELHELPGVCAHYVVDRIGTIHQLVDLKWMCRHTVGLNWTAIGIEHVGTSDHEILANRRQLDASLRLVRWLQEREGIMTKDVIGHAESLTSPYHRERVKRLRKQTHGDFSHASMQVYRRKLAAGTSTRR
jgi:beta-N-acetylhexosaminidase